MVSLLVDFVQIYRLVFLVARQVFSIFQSAVSRTLNLKRTTEHDMTQLQYCLTLILYIC